MKDFLAWTGYNLKIRLLAFGWLLLIIATFPFGLLTIPLAIWWWARYRRNMTGSIWG